LELRVPPAGFAPGREALLVRLPPRGITRLSAGRFHRELELVTGGFDDGGIAIVRRCRDQFCGGALHVLMNLAAEALGKRFESSGELLFKGHVFEARIMADRSEK